MGAAVTDADRRIGDLIQKITLETPLRAAGFIVTIYGDVVEPRGGVAWVGNLIETCAIVGISETLVRTAVSRLVAAGQLVGEREGRRSYYGLSQAARTEFAVAATTLFGGTDDHGWQFAHALGDAPEEAMAALERMGYSRVNARLAVGPIRHLDSSHPLLLFKVGTISSEPGLRAFVAENWDLERYKAAYRAFMEQFSPLADGAVEGDLTPAMALTARLLLIHRFRSVLLHDPRLPDDALPTDWPGREARVLFARLYMALSSAADRYIAENFVSPAGGLAARSSATDQRLASLKRSA
ncbi:PaaX family transcriptional regulator (plasmid) [Rhizobium grahamii]|uniref:PaaX family transcriptional regulator n=1 Tax=Rhizobium grahamii TaxID=1120045 RepID=A0A5Q0CHD4_9HYPH|nr:MULTISPECIES: PaaX family transcriptional regulator C-terminal domain-containing protein [Rhizobium]QFY63900.1 PaaX family transcriptional regulator [Rhizobium grahamii]QRM52854.1 PaaX family transcriptional regulator [Rhizobium sp. BG6]